MLETSKFGILSYQFAQATPSAIWSITHNLGQKPIIDINIVHNGLLVKAFPLSIEHVDVNNVQITWSGTQQGNANLIVHI